MWIAEPNRTSYDVEFRVGSFPVRVHPLFWLVAILLGAKQPFDVVDVLLWVLAVFVSILVHELGHAVLIRLYHGRPHIVLYTLGGLALYQPRMLNQKTDPTIRDVCISGAGPTAGFLLATLILLPFMVTGTSFAWLLNIVPIPMSPFLGEHPQLFRLVFYFLQINILWGLINLLPILPLDGGHIVKAILERFDRRDGARKAVLVSLLTSGGLAILILLTRPNEVFLLLFCAMFAVQNYQQLQSFHTYR